MKCDRCERPFEILRGVTNHKDIRDGKYCDMCVDYLMKWVPTGTEWSDQEFLDRAMIAVLGGIRLSPLDSEAADFCAHAAKALLRKRNEMMGKRRANFGDKA